MFGERSHWIAAAVVAASAGLAKADPNFTAFLVPDAAATAAANTSPSDVTINGQNVTVTSVGDQVVMDIYVSIQQSNGNQTDDGLFLYKAAYESRTGAIAGTQGIFNDGGNTYPNITVNSPSMDPATSQGGVEFNNTDPGVFTPGGDPLTNTVQQGDANSNDPTEVFSQFATGGAPVWGNGAHQETVPRQIISSTNPTQFLLGTITWTATNIGPALDTIQIMAQPGLIGGVGNTTVAQFYSDAGPNGGPGGTDYSMGHYPEMGAATNLLSGPPVIISPVPEPTSVGVVALGISVLGVRARRRMRQ